MAKKKFLNIAYDYLLLTVGTIIYCMGWTSFLIPNGLASGGLTGLCTIIQYGTGIPIGWTFPAINVVLLLIGMLALGKGFGFKTIYVIALSSVLFEVLPRFEVLQVTTIPDMILVAIVGAAMESIGIGMTLLRGCSS